MVVPDRKLLGASFEIARAYPLFPMRFAMRNFWYFLYKPGFHTRYNIGPIFQGGLFYPPDGQAAIGGALYGAAVSMLGLPPRATQEIGFDPSSVQSPWIRYLYRSIRMVWLGSTMWWLASYFFS
jgi:hypothetical protein